MADPVVEFVTDWIEENVTPELSADGVDQEALQDHVSQLIADARVEGISEEDIDETGLDVPALIEAALKSDPADDDRNDADVDDE